MIYMSTKETATTSVKLSKSAKTLLDTIAKRRGMGKIEVVSRALAWIYGQDDTLQAVIFDQIDSDDTLLVLEQIKRRIKSQEKPMSIAQQKAAKKVSSKK